MFNTIFIIKLIKLIQFISFNTILFYEFVLFIRFGWVTHGKLFRPTRFLYLNFGLFTALFYWVISGFLDNVK